MADNIFQAVNGIIYVEIMRYVGIGVCDDFGSCENWSVVNKDEEEEYASVR